LGDRTEKVLAKLGVTKDRYKSIKEKLGLLPSCSCDARKRWLNQVGRHLGIGADLYSSWHTSIENYIDFLSSKTEKVYSMKLDWSYGVTTVPERTDNLLQTSLASLAKSGFDLPRIFVDGSVSN
jgi:hypothetical protein